MSNNCRNIAKNKYFSFTFSSNALLCLISSIGIGLVLKVKASTGGLDIIIIVLSNKLDLNVSLIMYLMDTILKIGQLLFIDFTSIFYGILGALIMTSMIHKVVH